MTNSEEDLFTKAPAEYTSEEKAFLFEQYKLYVETADRISQRRQNANNFFLSVNTALAAVFAALSTNKVGDIDIPSSLVISTAGITLSYTWIRGIRSYREINTGKFAIIHKIEDALPLRLYRAEWVALGEGKDPKRYLPFTKVENVVPWVFVSLYVVLSLITVGEHIGVYRWLSSLC